MCGIAGQFYFSKFKDNNFSIEKVLKKMKFRGPDSTGTFENTNSSFGINRLAINDKSELASQPLFNENKDIVIIFNGEIYNHKELKDKYFPNKKYFTKCDSEILTDLFDLFSINFINLIKGMFSIAIIDKKNNKRYLIRDRFGIKPLYYFSDYRGICFSSEIAPLFEIDRINKELNEDELIIYLQHGLINSNNQSWFKNINQLSPGHFLEIDNNSFSVKRYYDFEKNINSSSEINSNKSFYQLSDKYLELLDNSFDQHLDTESEIGIHISGGIDSAVMSSMINKKKFKLKSFTFDYDNSLYEQYSETRESEVLSNLMNSDHTLTTLKDHDLEKELNSTMETEYEPFSSLRIVAQHLLYKNNKNESKVILDGSGGDELGAGYPYYLIPYFLDMVETQNLDKVNFKIKSIIKNLYNSNNSSNFILSSLGQFNFPGVSTIDGTGYKKNNFFLFENINYVKKRELYFDKFKSNLLNAQCNDLFHYKLPRSLRYCDRSSSRYSMETRVPFLDHDLVEHLLSVPSEYKFGKKIQRFLFKYPHKKIMGKEIFYRNKKTLADPQTYWIKNTLREMVYDICLSSDLIKKYINKNKLSEYIDMFINSKENRNSYLIGQIFILGVWEKNILNQ